MRRRKSQCVTGSAWRPESTAIWIKEGAVKGIRRQVKVSVEMRFWLPMHGRMKGKKGRRQSGEWFI
jgi:hypothetical protein